MSNFLQKILEKWHICSAKFALNISRNYISHYVVRNSHFAKFLSIVTRSAQINLDLFSSCRAQKIKFIEGLTYKFLSKIKALQELHQNVGASYKKLTLPFLVHHCRNLKSGICTISFLLRSLYMFITVYHSFPIIPIFIFLNSHPGSAFGRPVVIAGLRPAMTTGGLDNPKCIIIVIMKSQLCCT